MRKIIFPIILIFCLLFSSIQASAYQISGFELNAQSAVLLSLDTDEILYSKNINNKVYPASLSKLLSAIIIIENSPDLDSEKIVMTQGALNEILGTGSSVIGLKVGEELTARQALACLLVSSGGDCSYAVAHHYGGDTEGFMQMVNAKAAQIGMENSHFGNPVGLHDEQTYTTVSDLIKLAKYALKYDVILELSSLSRYTLEATNMSPARRLTTTNLMIDNSTSYYYIYAKGVKTGFTDEAGRCLISTASYNGYNYLCILTGCKTINGTRNEFVDSRNLYRWAFNNFSYKTVVEPSSPVCEIPVRLSSDTDFVSLYASEPLNCIFPNDADMSTLKIIPHLNSSEVKAPIKKGAVMGTADIIYAEEKVGTVELVAGNDVASNVFLVAFDGVTKFFKSTPFIVVISIIGVFIFAFVIACVILNLKRPKKRKVRYIPYDADKENSPKKK